MPDASKEPEEPIVIAVLIQAVVHYFVTKRPSTTAEAIAYARRKPKDRIQELSVCIRETIKEDHIWGRLAYREFGIDKSARAQIADIQDFSSRVLHHLLEIY